MRKKEKQMRGKEKPSELGCVSSGKRRFRVRWRRSCPKQLRVSSVRLFRPERDAA